MNGDRVFIDTNIFIYAKLMTEPVSPKHRYAIDFLKDLGSNVAVSTQVINEFSSVLIKHGVENENIRRSVEEIADACFVSPLTIDTVRGAWLIRDKHSYSYWDCLIIASALENRCTKLFTEDMQHDQIIFERLTIINPFHRLI